MTQPEYIDLDKQKRKAETLHKGLYLIHMFGIIAGASGVGMVWALLSHNYIVTVILFLVFLGFLPPLKVDRYGEVWGVKRK